MTSLQLHLSRFMCSAQAVACYVEGCVTLTRQMLVGHCALSRTGEDTLTSCFP